MNETAKPELIPGAEADSMQQASGILAGRQFVKTGEYRTPKKGDIFLSAWRELVAVQAESDFCQDKFYILREASPAERA